jgi:preprotein translocase subunit SecA
MLDPPQDIHYTVDEKQRNVLLTEDGYEAVEDVLQVCGWVGGWGTMWCSVCKTHQFRSQ